MIVVHCKMTPMSVMRNALSMQSEIIRAYVDKRSKFDTLTDFISCNYGLMIDIELINADLYEKFDEITKKIFICC